MLQEEPLPSRTTPRKKRKANDWDNAWKEVIQQLFPAFLEFLFPAIHALIDWSHEPVFLEQELRQATRRAKLKKTAVDKLIRVHLVAGGFTILLIHVEFQNQKEEDLPLRLYTYNTAIFSLLQQPLITLAILGDRDPDWRPERYGYGIGSFSTQMHFPIAKLLDYEARRDVLEHSENPFAVVVMAHLKGMETVKRPQSRLEWKLSLTKALFERNLDIDETYQLIDFIDWLMVLDDKREALFDEAVKIMEEKYQMTTTLPPRQIRLIERSREQGKLEGELETLRSNIKEVLEIRFGKTPEEFVVYLQESGSASQLRSLFHDVLTATNLDELRAKLN